MAELSRQRQWQLRKQEKGLCPTCGRKRAVYALKDGTVKTAIYCERHMKAARVREHNQLELKQWRKKKPIIKEP